MSGGMYEMSRKNGQIFDREKAGRQFADFVKAQREEAVHEAFVQAGLEVNK